MIQRIQGQVLVIAILIVLVLAITIPAIVRLVQNESTWTAKSQRSTRAFALAEAAVERGYQQLLLSTSTWNNVLAGTIPSGYNFDQTYTDSGGSYEIRLSSSGVQEISVVGVGKDTSGKEIRAIQAVYAIGSMSGSALFALNGVTIEGNPDVEWGPVISPSAIDTDAGHLHPRLYSAASIDPFDTSSALPNSDSSHYWAYETLPPAPTINLTGSNGYKSSAYAVDGSASLGSGPAGSIYYYTSAVTPTLSPGNNHFIDGDLIVEGNLSMSGNPGNGSNFAASIPSTAWREYASDWSTYHDTFDATYATYASVPSTYAPTGLTYSNFGNKIFIHGFLYVGGTFSVSGGGNTIIIGTAYIGSSPSLGNSHVTIYYDATVAANVKLTSSSPSRISWQDQTGCTWSGSHASCP